jgi:hypothetical protein
LTTRKLSKAFSYEPENQFKDGLVSLHSIDDFLPARRVHVSCDGISAYSSFRGRRCSRHRLLAGSQIQKQLSLTAESVATLATLRPSPGIQSRTRLATHIHCSRKQMHDDIATAENGDSQADVDERVLQGLVCFQVET